jgi:hypothetical protein
LAHPEKKLARGPEFGRSGGHSLRIGRSERPESGPCTLPL